MNKEEWFCVDCPKSKAHKHEELWSFTQYANNLYKKEDALQENQRCGEHFKRKEKEFNEKLIYTKLR